MATTAVALTIAGSDSSGGAGIQADLKTFHAYGVFGTSAITAVTVQNTMGVKSFLAIPPQVVRDQIVAVAEDLAPASCKTGMLASAELVHIVAQTLREMRIPSVVVDPVMIATSGDRLLDRGAEHAIIADLFPLATLVTPNLDEAAVLAECDVQSVAAMEDAARRIHSMGAKAVLIKGGHLGRSTSNVVVDVLFDGATVRAYERPRIQTKNTHGTGCTLSAANAADLALGNDLVKSVERALDFVHRAIETAPNLGQGSGPLNHLTRPRS
jgi:hydroxymethylpyrimidine/phosphomethylpyrimidine kinase